MVEVGQKHGLVYTCSAKSLAAAGQVGYFQAPGWIFSLLTMLCSTRPPSFCRQVDGPTTLCECVVLCSRRLPFCSPSPAPSTRHAPAACRSGAVPRRQKYSRKRRDPLEAE